MKFMGATRLRKELGRLKKKKKKKKKKNAWVSSESSRFAYRVFTGPFSYFKLANSNCPWSIATLRYIKRL